MAAAFTNVIANTQHNTTTTTNFDHKSCIKLDLQCILYSVYCHKQAVEVSYVMPKCAACCCLYIPRLTTSALEL
jgi:hypothetical protein